VEEISGYLDDHSPFRKGERLETDD